MVLVVKQAIVAAALRREIGTNEVLHSFIQALSHVILRFIEASHLWVTAVIVLKDWSPAYFRPLIYKAMQRVPSDTCGQNEFAITCRCSCACNCASRRSVPNHFMF